MFILYTIIVLLIVGFVLWVMLCFHNVLQRQRALNAQWVQVSLLIEERDAILGDFQNLWVAPDAPAPDARLARLQELLAADIASDWTDVEGRAALRQQIEEEVLQLMTVAQNDAALSHGDGLASVQSLLRDNGADLAKNAELYNRHVRVYNALLQVNPNRVVAQRFGLVAAPLYSI